ncbi:uncharacterized protein LOC110185852 [Drosophila serrata]|uniref:uncharacterized protein LOC110185852 n=1 Tax=Drosophila serrata TaxID=7274 RepID=UPI000A1D2A6A|nr:uncharacterized protein LOC110185852 [Drosophila serrata]
MPGGVRPFSHKHIWQQLVRHCTPQSQQAEGYKNGVVIASAVRTPSAPIRAEEQQLAGMIVDELAKRTTVPRKEFTKLIFSSSSKRPEPVCKEHLSNVAKDLGFKCETLALQDDICSISGLQMTIDSLQSGNNQVIITGDTRRQVVQPEHGVLANELMSVRHLGISKRLAGTNQALLEPAPTLGGAALAWTTQEAAQRLQLQPLALLREFWVKKDDKQVMYRLNENNPITPSEVYTWNVVTGTEKGITESMIGDLYPKRLCTHDFKQVTASHLLTHLVHSLPSGGLGCAFIGGADGSMIMFLEKLAPKIAQDDGRPLLTLYTRDPCPLCDELVHRLEQEFDGRYRLEKVYIDRKENVRFLRLFRDDIPVVFLNGQFLCMHQLNEEALRERLQTLPAKCCV